MVSGRCGDDDLFDHGGEELPWRDVVGDLAKLYRYGGAVLPDPVPTDQGEAGGGVAAVPCVVPQFADHVDRPLERADALLGAEDGAALNEEEASRREWVAAAQVGGIAVGLFEPVGQVLGEGDFQLFFLYAR